MIDSPESVVATVDNEIIATVKCWAREKKIEWLKEKLMAGKTEVRFKKVDGSDRVMVCTTNPVILEKLLGPTESHSVAHTKDDLDYIRVYDIMVDGWRTINYDSVYQFKTVC